MNLLVKRSLHFSGNLFVIALLAGCAGHSSSSAPTANTASGAGIAPGGTSGQSYQLSQVRDYGVSNSDKLLHLELDGQFAGNGDVVSVSCTTNGSPTIKIDIDTPSKITITLSPIDDICTFSVEGAANATQSLSLSSTAPQLPALSLNAAIDTVNSSLLDVGLASMNFTANSQDIIYYSCDGKAFQSATTSVKSIFIFFEVAASIPAPLNPLSCEYYVEENGIQSAVVNAFNIESASWSGLLNASNVTLNIYGSFTGSNDSVQLSCTNGTATAASVQNFSTAQLATDQASSITLQIPAPTTDLTCKVSVSSGTLQTASIEADFSLATSLLNPILNPVGITTGLSTDVPAGL